MSQRTPTCLQHEPQQAELLGGAGQDGAQPTQPHACSSSCHDTCTAGCQQQQQQQQHRQQGPPALLPMKEHCVTELTAPPTEMAPPTFWALFSTNSHRVKLALEPAGSSVDGNGKAWHGMGMAWAWHGMLQQCTAWMQFCMSGHGMATVRGMDAYLHEWTWHGTAQNRTSQCIRRINTAWHDMASMAWQAWQVAIVWHQLHTCVDGNCTALASRVAAKLAVCEERLAEVGHLHCSSERGSSMRACPQELGQP